MTDKESISPKDYAALVARAKAIVQGITGPEERDIAFDAILAHLVSDGATAKKKLIYFSHWSNTIPVAIAALLAVSGYLSLNLRWAYPASFCIAVLINVAILCLMIIVGLHSDGRANTYKLMPHRLPSLMIGAFLFTGLLFSFGDMYLSSGGICPGGQSCPTRPAPNPDPKVAPPQSQVFSSDKDAIYFSCVTMTTLGYGDYSAGTDWARGLVIWQLLSSFSLILLLLPLIVSRLASY
jgi:hypothetical protein